MQISLNRKWSKNFWPDCNFSWCLAVLEVNRALASGHFRNGGVVQPSMDFWRALEIDFLKNTIGVEFRENIRPKRTSRLPSCVPCDKIEVKHRGGIWYPSFKKVKSKKVQKQNYEKQNLSELFVGQ